jgi:membrane-anchored protein YejM (alkaline phosphatase superfamily)
MLSGAEMPHISGVHGALKAMADPQRAKAAKADQAFSAEQLKMLHAQQIRCVEYLDGLIGKLMAKAPENTYFIVTADHGELFGEDGYFGHGPIMHEKCFEIPFVEGRAVAER